LKHYTAQNVHFFWW